jgi:hypothetical protein
MTHIVVLYISANRIFIVYLLAESGIGARAATIFVCVVVCLALRVYIFGQSFFAVLNLAPYHHVQSHSIVDASLTRDVCSGAIQTSAYAMLPFLINGKRSRADKPGQQTASP